MPITTQDVINRARIYVDDNHKVTDGWKQPADWLSIAGPEIIACYRKWVREGVVALATVDSAFTGPGYTFPAGVIAITDVVENLGSGSYRKVESASSVYGREPFWDSTTGTQGSSQYWTAAFGTTGYTLKLHPPDTAAYIVRNIPEPDISTLTSVLYLPTGLEDYVALRVARKALASEGSSSQSIERLITVAEAEWKMLSLGTVQGDGPRVRITHKPKWGSNSRHFTWQTNPYFWYYP